MGPVKCALRAHIQLSILETFSQELKKLLLLFQFSRKFFLKMEINVYP